MTNQRAFVALAADAIGEDNRQWIEVMPTTSETTNGGSPFVVTREDLETYAACIRANAGQTPVDYDHEGAYDRGSTKASGWFTGQAEVRETDARGPILCAEVEWTRVAAQSIRDGEYRFISAEFTFHDTDAKTGLRTRAKELLAATLTNRPFFTELAPVAARLSDVHADAIASALGVDRDRVVAAAATADEAAAAASPPKEDEMADDAKKTLRETLGLAETATQDEVDAAAIAALAKNDPAPAGGGEPAGEVTPPVETPVAASTGNGVIVDKDALEELKTRADNGQKAHDKLALAERVATVDAAVKAGKIPPAGRDASLARMARDEAGETTYLESLAENTIPVAARGGAPAVDVSDSREMDAVMASFGLAATNGKGN